MSADLNVVGAPASSAVRDCFRATGGVARLPVLASIVLAFLASGGALACEALALHRGEIEHHLARAEEHREWVELWSGLDDREARLELAYFADRLRRVGALLRGNPCGGGAEEEILSARIRHEVTWSERKAGLLRERVKVSRTGQ